MPSTRPAEVRCWADGEDEYLVGHIDEGVEMTHECGQVADPDCALDLCRLHCWELHRHERALMQVAAPAVAALTI